MSLTNQITNSLVEQESPHVHCEHCNTVPCCFCVCHDALTGTYLDGFKTNVDLASAHLAKEMQASYFYRNAASSASYLNFTGFAAFFEDQRRGEEQHSQKLIDYIAAIGEQPSYVAIFPPALFSGHLPSIAHTVQAAYDLELYLKEYIKQAASLADDQGWHEYRELLDTYIADQVIEVDTLRRLEQDVQAAYIADDTWWIGVQIIENRLRSEFGVK